MSRDAAGCRTPAHHCATLLEGVLDSAYSLPEYQETMGALLPSILSGLVAAVEVDARVEASSSAVSNLSASCHFLASLDPAMRCWTSVSQDCPARVLD